MTAVERWEDLASCIGMEVRFFHKDDRSLDEVPEGVDPSENYEDDEEIAKITDQICLSCPVIKQCLDKGQSTGQWGVWGGVYLSAGKIDKTRNSHKTKEIWKEWSNRVDLT